MMEFARFESKSTATTMDAKFEVRIYDGEEDEHDVEFTAEFAGMKITMSPEYPKAITGVDVAADCETFDSRPGNGEFNISWNGNEVELCVGKCGDGRGGGMTVTLLLTPNARESLRSAMKKWKDAFAE